MIVELGQTLYAGGQIERSGYTADSGNDVRFAEFARELQRYIPAERKTGEEERQGRHGFVALFEEEPDVVGQAGVVEGLCQLLGASAGADVEAVGDEAGVEQVPREAEHIAGIAAAFEAMDEDGFGDGLTVGPVGFDQNLGVGIGLDVFALVREAREIEITRPEVG